jgi:hypothetical protein
VTKLTVQFGGILPNLFISIDMQVYTNPAIKLYDNVGLSKIKRGNLLIIHKVRDIINSQVHEIEAQIDNYLTNLGE